MNCRECELLIAGGESDGAAGEHLRACAECRALAGELRANAAAFAAMREEEMPGLRPVAAPPAFPTAWVAAAAAAVLAMAAVSALWIRGTEPAESRLTVQVPAPQRTELPGAQAQTIKTDRLPHPRALPHKKRSAPEEPLMVKMLTDDPDVVIYWFGDGKEKAE